MYDEFYKTDFQYRKGYRKKSLRRTRRISDERKRI